MIDDIVIIDNVIPLEKQEELKQQTARAVISTAQFHPGPDAGNTSFGE
jgi:hypothetical protein